MAKRAIIDLYDGPTTIGIDVSDYQGDVDWPRVARSEALFAGRSVGPVRYAIVRAADGVQTRRDSAPDPRAVRNLVGAHEAGLLVAVYIFVRAYHDPTEQLELVLEVIRTAGVPIGFVAIDIEGRPDDPDTKDEDESDGAWWTPDGVTTPVATSRVLWVVRSMAEGLRARGIRPIVYTGVAWHWHIAQRGQGAGAEIGELWTPYYTRGPAPALPVGPRGEPAPWPRWTLWQFAGSRTLPGKVPGIAGIVDLNRFRGDEAALRRWWTAEFPVPAAARIEAAVAELLELARGIDSARAAEIECACRSLLATAEQLG